MTNGRIPGKAVALGLIAGLFAGIGYLCGGPTSTSRPSATMPASVDAMTTADGVPIVRVRIIANAGSVEIDAGDDRGAVTYDAAAIAGPIDFPQPDDGRPIKVRGRSFRGNMRIVPSVSADAASAAGEPATFDVINIVSIEEYLRGVVPSEMYATWPPEALQAQAIAARTYALYQIKSRESAARTRNEEDEQDAAGTVRRAYDLNADTSSQAFRGIERESPVSDAAVDATRGIVLASGPAGAEKIFCSLYSQCCGGATLGGADYGNGDPTPALAEHLGDGCADAPKFTWPEFAVPKDELARRMRTWGQRRGEPIAGLGTIRAIEIDASNTLGRPIRFAVVDESGTRFVMRSEQFRNACNNDRGDKQALISAFVTPVVAGDQVRFTEGRGNGHGVGLCQYCANGWARRGLDHKQILDKSYPGAVLVRAY